jgi:hypothetical protein
MGPFCPARALPLVDRIAGMLAAAGGAHRASQPTTAPLATSGTSAQEGSGTMTYAGAQTPPAVGGATRTADGWNATGRSLPRPAARRAAIGSIAVFLVVALVGAAAFFGLRGHGRSSEGTMVAASVVPAAPPTPASEIVAAPPAAGSTTAVAAPTPTAPSSSVPAAGTARPTTPAPPAAPAPLASARPRHVHGDAGATVSAPAPAPSTPAAQRPGILDTSN